LGNSHATARIIPEDGSLGFEIKWGIIMGVGLRIFIIDDGNSIKRLPQTLYERLLRRDHEESFPQYAGKRVRCAEATVQLVNRKPVAILRIVYLVLSFDAEGRIDLAEKRKGRRLAMEAYPLLPEERGSPQVIDASHRFAKKHYERVYKWKPTPEIEAAIIEAIFG